MSSRKEKPGPRGISITRNPYGYSIAVRDKNPDTMFLPPDPRELRNAVKNARTIDRMPRYKHG